jgi:protein SCO1
MKYFLTITVIVISIGAAVFIGWMQTSKRDSDSNKNPHVVTANVELGGEFALTDHNGNRVTDKDFKDKLMLVYFGYTFCPDFCPAELTAIAETLKMFGSRVEQIQPLFISIDPERDSQEVLKNYVAGFHPKLLGLRGNPGETEKIKEAYKIYAAKTQEGTDSDYLVDHTTFVYLMGRDGKFITMFKYGTPPQSMYKEIKKHL